MNAKYLILDSLSPNNLVLSKEGFTRNLTHPNNNIDLSQNVKYQIANRKFNLNIKEIFKEEASHHSNILGCINVEKENHFYIYKYDFSKICGSFSANL